MSASAELSTDGRLARLNATVRALTCRYVLALGLVATLASIGFLILQKTIEAHEASSSILNLSARQRTLVQETAGYAEDLVEEGRDASRRAAYRARLFESAHAIERAHLQLTDPGNPLGQPVESSPEVGAMYFGAPLRLDRKIRTFIDHAFRLSGTRDADLGTGHPSYRSIVAAEGPLLISLSALVDQLEADARANVRRSQKLETGLLMATLLMLTLEALFIFRPIIRRVGEEGSKLVESQDRLVELAHFDPLTRLANRTLFRMRLEMALRQARRDGTLVAVLQLDLDHFKDVNDTLGHTAGDHLLREVARRLQRLLRDTDTIARIGGDEFAIILTDLRAAHHVGAVAEKIVRTIADPVVYGSEELHTAVSVGITIYPLDDDHPEQLLRNADIALYQAKSAGRNTFAFFVGEMKAQVERRARVETDLRRALAGGGFEIFYQPQVRIADGALIGLEALLRWRHPELGLLGPNAFLPVVEESALALPIGFTVVQRTLAQMGRWIRDGIAPARLAINVAGAQLRAGPFLDDLDAALAEHGVEPERVELDITEGVMIGRSHERVADVLAAVRERGVSVALDDFGTGHASLAHLKRMKVDRLKVDRSFVRDIETDPEDAAIVRAVINLGRSLGQEIVAEGVETEAQLDFLREHGCQLAQGFYFGRPQPAADIEPLLRRSAPPFEATKPRLVHTAS